MRTRQSCFEPVSLRHPVGGDRPPARESPPSPVMNVGGESAQIALGGAFEKDLIHAVTGSFERPGTRQGNGSDAVCAVPLRSHSISAASSTRSSNS